MVQSVVEGKPWFKYTFKQDRVEIVSSPKKKINKFTAYSVASKLSDALNEGIQNGPIQIGKVFYPTNINDKVFVMIAPSTEQLNKLNKNEELVIENEDRLLKNQTPIIDTFSEEELELNKEEFKENEPYTKFDKFIRPEGGQFTLFNAADSTIDGKDEMIKHKYFPNSNENTSTDVLQKIALSDHPLAPIAANLLQFDPKVPIELVEGEDLGDFVDDSGEVRTAAAIYSNNKIKIARYANFKGLGSEPTLIHEIVHAMTNQYIKNNPNSEEVKALKEIYKHALTLKKDMPSDAYPFTNLDEFVVAVFTNASTIKFLLGQPSISKSEPNFLADIFKAIMNLFKLDGSNKTLFNDAFIAATNIIIAQDNANKRNQESTFFISDDGTLFSPTSETVKPGVSELFESNPELANQVYEAAGFVRSDKVLSENYENYFSEIQDMSSAIFDNLENADLLYSHYQIKELDIDSLDLSKKTAGFSDNASDYLKDELKSTNDQKTPILINSRGEVVEGWHRIQSLKANGVKTVKVYVPITLEQKQQALQLYSSYLDGIFPNSKVKDIVYHGTPDGQFENFDISKSGKLTGTSTKGIYFTDGKRTADFYAESSIDFSQFESIEEYEAVTKAKVFPAILDAKNLKLVDDPQAQEKQGDVILRTKDKLSDIGLTGYAPDLAHQYIVFEPEQIHILGSNQDIEGFKKFTDSSPLLQLEGVNQTEASPETVAKLTELLESLNIPVEQMDELFAQLGVNGLADGVNRLIQIAKGKESVALAEETMHMLTLMAPAEMMDTLMENITDYKIYKEVYERYKGHPAYQNEDGSPNERMIKLEAVGKLLAEYYIMNAENLSPEEVNVAKTIWSALKDWIKNVFGARVDSFQDFINKVNSGKYFSENIQTRDMRLLQLAFTKEDSSDMADTLIAGLTTMSSYEKAQKQFKKDSRINMVPEVRAMMALENAISTFTMRDLPEINNLQSFIHLPKKRAFATSKFKLKEANKKIDAIDDATYFKQFKDKALQSLEYIRNMHTVADNLTDRVNSIKKSIKNDVNYDRDGYPALDPNDRMRMYYEMEMIQSTMEIYKNELEQLANLFEDLGEGNPVSNMIKEVNSNFSNALVDTGNLLKGNLRETLSKFIEPQVEQYKKLQNKELIEFQKQLNKVDQEIAKQKAKGKSTTSLEKDKVAIEDKMDMVQENIDNPPISVNNLMDILENSESARTSIDKISITRILEAGRTNKNQAILAIATLLNNATLDSHKAAETSQGILRTIFNKFKRAQNIKGTEYNDVVDQVVRYKFNEKTGELEEYDDRVLTRDVKQWLFEDDLEVLKYLYNRAETNAADIDEIVKEYKKYMGEDLTAAEKVNLVDTFKNKHNDLIKNFGKTKYNDAYNQVQKILDDVVLSTGQTVREYRRAFVERLTDASDIINDVISDEVALEIALEDKAGVIKELQQLESTFDYNTGQDKTGDALLVAETILKWKKAKKKVEVSPGVFASIDEYYTTYTTELEWKQQKDELETAIADAQISYAASPTQANKDALANIENTYSLWRKMNVSMQAPEQFYIDRAQIIEAIQSIIETTKINNRAEEAFDFEYDLAWQTLSSLTKGSRDDNGVIEGSGLMAASDKIKAAEQEIENLRNTIKNLRTRMSESDYNDMNDLMDKLNDMQESSLTDYWDKMFISKFNNEKAIMMSNGMDSPTSAEVTDSLMQTQFFKDNTLDVTDKYSQVADNDLPKDVIRYYKSLGQGRMVIRTVKPIYIWRQSLPKGQYAKEDQMSFNLKNYKVNPIFENPEHETMDGKISLDPSKVIPNGITPSRYENKKYSALKQDQTDFLDEVRAFYYADQMKKSRKDRLGDSLPRISAVKAGRKMQLLNPKNWRLKKTFSKEAISDRIFGNTTTEIETEYAEARAKNDNKRIFAKYTHGTTTHSTQEKDLFKLLAMYNAEVHRAEKLNEYVPALNAASKIAADKKFSASLEYQINYGLNKTSKKAIAGKKVDAYADGVRSAKGFFRLGFPWQVGSVIKNTATGSFAIWSNSSKLKQYSEGMFTKAYAKALPFAVQLVAERFVATPSKKTAILRRLNVVSGYDINDAVGNNADILLKTANGLGYAMGSIRAASETHLDLTMYELYRSGNPIIVNGQAIDIEDMYDYDNGVLTPKPGLTSQMENMLTNSVEEMKSYTQGNFASNNVSLIQQNFVGRSVLFMRKHIYNPLMRRIGTKRYTGTGHEIEGFYRVIGAMLSSSWTNKNMGYLTNRSNEENIAVNAFMKDVVATSFIGGALYLLEKAFKQGDGDDDENWLAWYTLLIFRKVVSEISFLNPVEKVATVHHVLTTAGYNKQSGNPINSAMMYAVMNPAKELVYTFLTPVDVNQLKFKEKFDSTDPYYSQFNNQAFLYNFLRTISWKNDYQNAKSSLKSYEWYNPSGFQFTREGEFAQSSSSKSRKKRKAGL